MHIVRPLPCESPENTVKKGVHNVSQTNMKLFSRGITQREILHFLSVLASAQYTLFLYFYVEGSGLHYAF